jgi:hypothetical protein
MRWRSLAAKKAKLDHLLVHLHKIGRTGCPGNRALNSSLFFVEPALASNRPIQRWCGFCVISLGGFKCYQPTLHVNRAKYVADAMNKLGGY